MTLIDALEQAARTERGIDFIVGRGQASERVSYAAFARAAAHAAGGLCARLGDARRPVLLVMPNGKELLTTFFGAMIGGLIPAILPPPRAFSDPATWVAGLAATAAHADHAPVVTTPTVAKLIAQHPAGAGITLVEVADVLGGPALTARARNPADTAFLQFTSGSLGAPKGVVLSHRAVLADAAAIAERVAVGSGDVGLFWVPLAHDMALLSFLMMLVGRIDQIALPTERFAIDPAYWLEVVAERATLTVGPPFAYGLARDRLQRKGVRPDLSRLRGAVVGAEPIDVGILRRFHAALAPAGLRDPVFIPSYGLAELTCVGCLGAAGGPLVTAPYTIDGGRVVELVGHGPPLSGHEVRIVRGDGAEAAAGELGRIQLRGPAAMDGYWRAPEATRAAFCGDWVVTGDLGFVGDFGAGTMVFIAGREKDVIIVRGRHFFPEELEALVVTVPGVRSRGALCFGQVDPAGGLERVVACVELEATAEVATVEHAIREAVADQYDLALAAVVPVAAGALPRTTSGKLRRSEARRIWGG
jgi:acyl-CoA synthetase (AMP-forming)/AMP-acid ligase II